MPYLVGAGLAVAVCAFATVVRLDRERAFYATVTIVVASYYVLFAVMGGSTRALVAETIVFAIFATGAVVGFHRDMRIVAVFLGGHGLLDAVHGALIANAGMPAYWPAFCGTFDVVAGLYLAALLHRRRALPAVTA
jgi:hypothetical protein